MIKVFVEGKDMQLFSFGWNLFKHVKLKYLGSIASYVIKYGNNL
jgi:hypothetical protein